jgi:uncharacterized membrane protein YphA (DoxX/SURF4 family)
MAVDALRKTCGCKGMLVVRVLAGLPLVFFGAMHLAGAMPMEPLVEAAGFPAPGVMAIVAPLAQLVAGLMLISGAFARLGGLIAIGTMAGAIMTHVRIPNDQWPVATTDATVGPWPEPTFMMFIAVGILAGAIVVLWRGAGAMSLDLRSSQGSQNATGTASADMSGG